jgi:N-acylglucosamine-6-phosphate 2-epimerase
MTGGPEMPREGRGRLPGPGIIVSLTPTPSSPWRAPEDIARLAEAAERGGAVAVKVDGPEAARAARRATGLPLIAVHIVRYAGGPPVITPTAAHAHELLDAGADMVEVEADSAARAALGQDAAALIAEVRALGAPVKAGVRTVADGLLAQQAGAAVIGSSTMGYGGAGAASSRPVPDLDLVAELVAGLDVPISAERGYAVLEQVRQAFVLGATFVGVGSAIADPVFLTAMFAAIRPPDR